MILIYKMSISCCILFVKRKMRIILKLFFPGNLPRSHCISSKDLIRLNVREIYNTKVKL